MILGNPLRAVQRLVDRVSYEVADAAFMFQKDADRRNVRKESPLGAVDCLADFAGVSLHALHKRVSRDNPDIARKYSPYEPLTRRR